MDVVAVEEADTNADRKYSPRLGNTFVAAGDSITATNSDRTNNVWGDSWATYACLASAGRMTLRYSCAQGGYTSSQILGIMQSEVWNANLAHNLLVIADGTNDSTPLTQTLINNEAMIKGAIKRGKSVVLCTIPPAGAQALGPPQTVTLTPITGTGTLAAGTYYYQMTTRGNTGQSNPSAEVSVVLPSTGSIQVDWTPVGGAQGYVIWGRITGTGKGLVFQNGPGTSQTTPINRYTDLGSALGGGTMPSVDTTAQNTYTTANRAKVAGVNQVKYFLARKYGLPIVDQYALVSDWAANGYYKPNYTSDGTHPTAKVQRLMGINVANTITRLLPATSPYLAIDSFDPTNLTPVAAADTAGKTGGLMTPQLVNGTRPSGWSLFGSGGGSTALAVDTDIVGYAYTITRTDWVGLYSDINIPGAKFAAGDLISIACKIKSSGLDAIDGGSVSVAVKATGNTSGNAYIASMSITRDVPTTNLPGGWAVWSAEGFVPPGTTVLNLSFNVSGAGASGSLAQLTVRNLTQLGLAP